MNNKLINDEFDDIPVANRQYINNNSSKILRILLFFSPWIFLIFSIIGLRTLKVKELSYSEIGTKSQIDERILGHFPYEEVSKDKLRTIQANIQVHEQMYDSLLKMQEDARADGVYLVWLSGFRSIKLQKEIFYSLKSLRRQIASERAKVSAPPGYSEHSTGFAIDIGDGENRNTDFEVSFSTTKAFYWLKNNASKYHFRLSFDRDNKAVDYEPWHWRYEGSIEALKIFESSNRK